MIVDKNPSKADSFMREPASQRLILRILKKTEMIYLDRYKVNSSYPVRLQVLGNHDGVSGRWQCGLEGAEPLETIKTVGKKFWTSDWNNCKNKPNGVPYENPDKQKFLP